jgi:environmental stress-induced protein Ves
MKITTLTRSDYQRMRWRNDQGWTTEIARQPDGPDGGDFDWRISIADIEQDTAFSRFDGIDRSLLLIEGNGLELFFEGNTPDALLRERGRIVRFAGETAARCRLIDGPTRDFNVMTRRGRCTHEAMFRPVVGPLVVFAESDVQWIAYMVSGHVREQHAATPRRLEEGMTWVIEPEGGSARQLVLDGAGEIILVRISWRTADAD